MIVRTAMVVDMGNGKEEYVDSKVYNIIMHKGYMQGRAEAFNEVKNAINGITQKYIKKYGADIIELYADVVTELEVWIAEQLKEKKE